MLPVIVLDVWQFKEIKINIKNEEIVSSLDEIIDDAELNEQEDNISMNVEVETNVDNDFEADNISAEVSSVIEEEEDAVADDDSEYTEIDLTENPLYQVLSTFFESSEGYNLCDILIALKDSVDQNNQLLRFLAEKSLSNNQSAS